VNQLARRGWVLRPGGRLAVAVTLCLTGIVALAAFNLTRGAPNVTLAEAGRALLHPGAAGDANVHFLLWTLRLPRVILGLSCGLALGLAGVLLQDALRNPLADPGLLGIAPGASFAVVLLTIYPEFMPSLPRPLVCLVAGLLAGLVVLVAGGSIRNPVRTILAGTVLALFFSTLTTSVLLLAPYERSGGLLGYYRYVVGSLSTAEWAQVQMVWPWLLAGLPAALLCGRALNLLQLGDELATSAGLNPFQARLVLIVIALVLVAPVVAAIGPLAFVALFAPHIARGWLATSDARSVLVLAALCGAVLVMAADTVGRLLFFPAEIPAGIWMVLVVGPLAIAVVGRTAQRAAR
jgi:iron complex transport system permease protein